MAETYNTDRFAVLYQSAQNPPVANLGLAGGYLQELFALSNIPAAFLGGWAMFLRGGGRGTNDIDMTVGCTMAYLIQVLSKQGRIAIPQIHGPTTVQLFVRTGGIWNPGYQEVAISVDIIIQGNLGTPMDLPSGTETIEAFQTSHGTQAVRVIDLYHQLTSKLDAFKSRRSPNDYLDITYLMFKYTNTIWGFAQNLKRENCQYYVDTYAINNDGANDRIQYVKQILGFPIQA